MFFFKKFTKNWVVEFKALENRVSIYNFLVYEHSLTISFKGDHRGLFWTLFILGFEIFELNVYDRRHASEYEPSPNMGLDF